MIIKIKQLLAVKKRSARVSTLNSVRLKLQNKVNPIVTYREFYPIYLLNLNL